jgi:hypothetical protein
VKRLSRPGGNATGFMQLEYSLSGKWLELLKQIAPNVNRAAVFRDPGITAGVGQFAVIQSVAPSVGVEVSPINTNDATADIERAVADFAREPNGGLITTAGASVITRRELFVTLAASGNLCRSHPEGRNASRYAGTGADQVRVGNQSQNRESTGPHDPAVRTRPRRRGDRIEMSAFGPKQTGQKTQSMSLLGGKAGTAYCGAHEADIASALPKCRLKSLRCLPKSGERA